MSKSSKASPGLLERSSIDLERKSITKRVSTTGATRIEFPSSALH